MKRKLIVGLVLIPSFAFSSQYMMRVGETSFDIEGWGEEIIEESEWINKGGLFDCSNDIDDSEVYLNKSYLKTKTCSQSQERDVSTYKIDSFGQRTLLSTVKENQVVPVSESSTSTGTHVSLSCNDILQEGHSNGNGIYDIGSSGSAYKAYCDMSSSGGGWTLLMMSRESIVNHDSMPRNDIKKTVTTPNYSTGITSPHNANILDLGTNKNVITEAVTKLAFNELRFECVGSACGEFPDTESIYFDGNKSAFSQKSGTLSRKSGGFPFSAYRFYYDGGNTSNPLVSIDTINLGAKCAKSTFRGYSACVRGGLVGLDRYSFQNAVGLGIYGKEWYAETREVNALLGIMYHRGYRTLAANVWVK